MTFRAGKKWKKISNREETTTSNNKDGLLYQDVDVPRDTGEDTNGERSTPNEASSQHDVKTPHSFRRGRDKSWTRDSRTRDEPPYKRRRRLDAGEDQDTNSPQKTQVDTRVLKRKREEEQVEGGGGEGTSQSSMMVAKRSKPDTNSCPVAGEGSVQSDDIPPTIPDTLSEESFTYHKVLGQGHFGKVLLASEKVSGHRLAIKILKKRQLLKERRTTAAINEKLVLQIAERSPFLCASFATFQTSDYLFYVMDYMVGGDLHQLIKIKAPFDMETTRLYTAELTCGLQFLHSRGIIHRDLKPLNVFIDGDSHAKIGDFGLSKIDVYEDQKVSGYAGTPKYMAPEVFRLEKYDGAVDWFSLGVIVCEMSSGKYPFYNGNDRMRLKMSILYEDPIYPRDLNTDIKDLINNLLLKSAEKRRLFVKEQLRTHLMFQTTDWGAIESGKLPPPSHMEPTPVQEEVIPVVAMLNARKPRGPPITPEEQQHFIDFSSVGSRWKDLQPDNLRRTTSDSSRSSVQGALADNDLFSSTTSSSSPSILTLSSSGSSVIVII
ncbi:unnamed protein product [Ranitomeya imitator]|uniref:Protein kinase domain-containing protein n=1 Tax=Ranitomeya imitator TaxID=111125 RepID=A0ABN9ML12_9NEOB|nr:unnamed protein product [Ranitomeya imitator]